MVDPKDKVGHQAHIDKAWSRIIIDLAARGLTDEDVSGLMTDAHIHDNTLTGWTFRVELNNDREPLIYTLGNQEGAELLCNGNPLLAVGEA